nr:alpha,alpha-trehalose-phosphate synthase [UDP-forming] 5 [Tanacetum cinerariifolium]
NIDVVAKAMDSTSVFAEAEKQMRHEKHYRKDRVTLTEWFSSCDNLGVAAENGYFLSKSYYKGLCKGKREQMSA